MYTKFILIAGPEIYSLTKIILTTLHAITKSVVPFCSAQDGESIDVNCLVFWTFCKNGENQPKFPVYYSKGVFINFGKFSLTWEIDITGMYIQSVNSEWNDILILLCRVLLWSYILCRNHNSVNVFITQHNKPTKWLKKYPSLTRESFYQLTLVNTLFELSVCIFSCE